VASRLNLLKQWYNETMKSQVKTIGAGGQIYLGKEFAGQHVLVTQTEPGVWRIKTASVIPHDELWMHIPENAARIDEGLKQLESTPTRVTSPNEMEALFNKALKNSEKQLRSKSKRS
jgi:putative transposon-encoded protein